MTEMSDLLDGQALWDYDTAGKLVRPPAMATAQQRAAFTLAAQRAAFSAMRYDPRQPRDRGGQWTDGPGGGAVHYGHETT